MSEIFPKPNPEDVIAPAQFVAPGVLRDPVYFSEAVKVEDPNTRSERIRSANTLVSLRDMYAFNPETPEVMDITYQYTTETAKQVMGNLNKGDAVQLFETVAFYAKPNFSTMKQEGDVLAKHNEHKKSMSLQESKLTETTRQFDEWMTFNGVEIKHQHDSKLFAAINTIGHEAGHALLGGVSTFVKNSSRISREAKLPEEERLVATRLYLINHPEAALTGNWKTDVASHEERFAEGFGNLVVSEAMRSLGYTERAVYFALEFFRDKTAIYSEVQGAHPIDWIGNIEPKKDLRTVASEFGLQESNAVLGYSMPLAPIEVAQELSDLSQIIKTMSSVGPTIMANQYIWGELVKAKQSDQTKRALEQQRAIRARAPVASSR